MLALLFVYPIIRFIANFINLVNIFIQYVRWYNEHDSFSNWRKYCAFIIAMLYLPNMKGRGAMAMFTVKMVPEQPAVVPFAICSMPDVMYAMYLVVIGFPILISGAFVYITTGLLGFAVIGILYGLNYFVWTRILIKMFGNRMGFDRQKYMAGFAMGLT